MWMCMNDKFSPKIVCVNLVIVINLLSACSGVNTLHFQ